LIMSTDHRIAFLFPGQGSQQVGMANAWLEQYSFAREWLAQLEPKVTTLPGHPSFSQALTQGPEEALKQTAYTQPAILLTALIAWRAFMDQAPPHLQPVAVAGHSLGEFGALVAAGVLTETAALELVVQRAALMQQAPAGAMSVVLGLSAEQVQGVINSLRSSLGPEEILVVANDNSVGQVVLAGSATALHTSEAAFKAAGAKRVMPLPVGGAFHSPLMAQCANQFEQLVRQTAFPQAARCPVICNVDGQPSQAAETIQDKLCLQMASGVQWRSTMNILVETLGVTTVIEFGPGSVLSGLMKKAAPQVRCHTLNTPEQLPELLQALSLQPLTVTV
jgi:[acyl-carrier-protein] S-malonyltransferase